MGLTLGTNTHNHHSDSNLSSSSSASSRVIKSFGKRMDSFIYNRKFMCVWVKSVCLKITFKKSYDVLHMYVIIKVNFIISSSWQSIFHGTLIAMNYFYIYMSRSTLTIISFFTFHYHICVSLFCHLISTECALKKEPFTQK